MLLHKITLTLNPLPKNDPIRQIGKKKIEEEAESEMKDETEFLLRATRATKEELFTIEERAKFLHDTIAAQRKFLAQQRSEAIRNRPPTKNQLRNQMMTYLKHVGNFKHSELKNDRLIKRMNKKDSSKGEEIKQESKEEVKEEDKGEENTRKRKHGTRKKMKSRKRRFKQDTSQDDPSDIEKENDELRLCLTIAPDEDKEVEKKKIMKYLTRSIQSLTGRLRILALNHIEAAQFSGVHTLMTDEGLVVHIAIEKKYHFEKGKTDANAKAKKEF
ncbi:hypothetical protein Tco_0544893 [Tanacetum coccineum]